MTLVTRNINNMGEPLCAPDGSVLAGVAVTFTLMSPAGLAIDVWDGYTYQRVAGLYQTTTDVNGVFSVNLWPTDRGSTQSVYLCHVDSPFVQDFMAALPSASLAPISWVNFMGGAIPLPPVDLSALAIHEADPNGHPAATESTNGFMSAVDKVKLDQLPGGGSVGIAMFAIAGQNLSGHVVVTLDSAGLAWPADRATASDMFRIAGLTQGAAAIGTQANILSQGLITEPSWSWTPYAPIYLGHAGALTQVVPTDGFLIVIGVALSATSMFVKPSTPLQII